MTSTGLTAPFALARYRDGGTSRSGWSPATASVALGADELGAADLNAFLAAPDWDRLAALAKPRTDGCRWPTSR